MAARVNYLNNRELLIEIHKSKKTFCSALDDIYMNFNVIFQEAEEVTKDLILETKQDMASKKNKAEGTNLTADDFTDQDVVIRIMTFDHIPLDTERKRKPRNKAEEHIRTNFPPFKHFIVDSWDGDKPILKEVCRSHWEGGFSNGHFTQEHGRITNRLGEMYMRLVERYSQRGNWRGYCVDEATEALTQRGWLNIDQINTDDTILSYDNEQLKWSSIKSIFRDDYDGNMFHLTVSGMDALVTPRHKFITDDGLKEVDYLLEKDRLILTGKPVDQETTTHSDSFVEMVGWAITEGNFYNAKDRNYTRVTIYQNEGEYSDRIRNCIKSLGFTWGESKKHNENGTTTIAFTLTKELCEQINKVIDNKSLSMEFILSLTPEQKILLINTMVDADGWRVGNKKRYCQKDKNHIDSFLALCTMAGLRCTYKEKEITSYGKPTTIYNVTVMSDRRNVSRVENIDFHGGKRKGITLGLGKITHPNEPTVYYKGRVWCPETEFGSFVCRRNGTIYLTGNTYLDEMKSAALVQLMQIGLRFDESRSNNPFAYYTASITNVFTRILNVEKKNQNIRDEILISQGVNPSYTRQVENEIQNKMELGEWTSSS